MTERDLGCSVFGLLTLLAWVAIGFAAPGGALAYDYDHATYDYDESANTAEPALDSHGWQPTQVGHSSALDSSTPAARGADEAFHYTSRGAIQSIRQEGLRQGSYATKRGDLSPLQAQIDLALPPNRGLRDAVVRVDLAGLRNAGYQVPDFTRVGRKFNMPGGGTEIQFGYDVPPQFLKVVRP